MPEFKINESMRETLSGFDGVWKRVSVETQPKASESGGRLEDIIRSLSEAARFDRALARRTGGACRSVMLRSASEAARMACRLRAEDFIASGKKYCEEVAEPEIRCPIDALRTSMRRDIRAVELLDSAAGRSDDPCLSRLYRSHACRLRRIAAEKRRVILHCFGA